jgi:hypothetical protein
VGYVILIVVVLVIVIVAATLTRRRGSTRAVTYAPSSQALGEKLASLKEVSPEPILSPEASTQEIVNREFIADTADDLLDPHNPHHAQWVREHPDVESDEEYLAEHPEDAPKSPES